MHVLPDRYAEPDRCPENPCLHLNHTMITPVIQLCNIYVAEMVAPGETICQYDHANSAAFLHCAAFRGWIFVRF